MKIRRKKTRPRRRMEMPRTIEGKLCSYSLKSKLCSYNLRRVHGNSWTDAEIMKGWNQFTALVQSENRFQGSHSFAQYPHHWGRNHFLGSHQLISVIQVPTFLNSRQLYINLLLIFVWNYFAISNKGFTTRLLPTKDSTNGYQDSQELAKGIK